MSKRRNIFGFVLIALGLLLVLRAIDPYLFGFRHMAHYLFPMCLIILGGWLIIRKRKHEEYYDPGQTYTHTNIHSNTTNTSSANHPEFHQKESTDQASGATTGQTGLGIGPERSTRFSKAFGDIFVDCQNMSLRSVEISSGMGDIEVKVHGGILADGLNRIVISGFIGDCRVLVPQGMDLFVHCSNFIGDIETMGKRDSGLGNNLDSQSPGYATADKRLYITASNFIGDIKIMEV